MQIPSFSGGNSIVNILNESNIIINTVRCSPCAGMVYSKNKYTAQVLIPPSWLESNNVSIDQFERWMGELNKLFDITVNLVPASKHEEYPSHTYSFKEKEIYCVTIGDNSRGYQNSHVVNGITMVLTRFTYDDLHYGNIVKDTFEILDSVKGITFFEAVQMACIISIQHPKSSYSDYYGLVHVSGFIPIKLVKFEHLMKNLEICNVNNIYKYLILDVNNLFRSFPLNYDKKQTENYYNLLKEKKYQEFYDSIKDEIPFIAENV